MTRILPKIFGKFLRKFLMITGRLRDFRPSFAIVRTWNQKCTGNHAKGKVSARIKDNSFFPYKIVTSIKTSLLSETWNFAPITSALLGKNWALPTTQNRIVILGNSSGTSGCSQHLRCFSLSLGRHSVLQSAIDH